MDRNAYCKRLWTLKLARAITPNAYLVGRALLRRASRVGQCWPSLDTIGRDVGCCAKTASRAVKRLRDLGVLEWRQRKGVLHRRASNVYALAQGPSVEARGKHLDSSRDKMSHGPAGDGLEAALTRLGAAIREPAIAFLVQ